LREDHNLRCGKDDSGDRHSIVREKLWCGLGTQTTERREVKMLDLFYIGVVVLFFVLMWGFTRASERL
jgi:hypothetical protein